jgi:hypothetical protein
MTVSSIVAMTTLRARLEVQIKEWRSQAFLVRLDRDNEDNRGTPEYEFASIAAETVDACADDVVALLVGEEPPTRVCAVDFQCDAFYTATCALPHGHPGPHFATVHLVEEPPA